MYTKCVTTNVELGNETLVSYLSCLSTNQWNYTLNVLTVCVAGADMIILSTAHNLFWYCCLTGAFATKLLPKTSPAVTVFADWPQCTEKMWARPAGSDAQKLRPDPLADHHSTTIRVWKCVQIYMLRSKLCGLPEKLPKMLCAGLVRNGGPLTMLWQHRWK